SAARTGAPAVTCVSPDPPPAMPANAEPSSTGASTSACSRCARAARTANAASNPAGGMRKASSSARPPSVALRCSSRDAPRPDSPSWAASTESATVAISDRPARSRAADSARTWASAPFASSFPPCRAAKLRAAASSSASGAPRAANAPSATKVQRRLLFIDSPPAEEPRDAQLDGQLPFQLGAPAHPGPVQHFARAQPQEEVVGEEDPLADAHPAAQRPVGGDPGDRVRRDALEQDLRTGRKIRVEVDRLLACERQLAVDGRPADLDPAHHPDVAGSRPQLPRLRPLAGRPGAHVDGGGEQRRSAQRVRRDRPALVEVLLDAEPDEDAAEEGVADGELEHRLRLQASTDVEHLGRHRRQRGGRAAHGEADGG